MFNLYKSIASRTNKVFSRFLAASGLIIILILLSGVYGLYSLAVPLARGGGAVKIEIKPGASAASVARELKESNLIRTPVIFHWWLRLSGYDNKIRAGQYYLSPASNALTIAKIISGELSSANELTLRFIEGWTLADIGKYLTQQGITSQPEFTGLLKSDKLVAGLLSSREAVIFRGALETKNLEGYLFPDTYRFNQGVTTKEVLNKMLDNFARRFNSNIELAKLPQGYSIHQVLTLASIVEKEVPAAEDRAMVADIFWRRLKAGLPLQADSTVNYVTGKKTPAASWQDLKVDSLYNTYHNAGLPPGPISNPGLSSLMAVLRPSANDYWYFLTTPTGQVIYSRDFKAHVAAKNKYLK